MTNSPQANREAGSGQLSRRTLAKGVAWAVPTVTIAAAAPATAASSCPPGCPTADFGGGINQNAWVLSTTGSFATGANQQIGFQAAYTPQASEGQCSGVTGGSGGGTISNAIIGQGDPTVAGSTITYAKTLCLKAGVRYTFTFTWNYLGVNPRSSTLQASVVPPTGASTTIGGSVTAASFSSNATGTRSASFTPTTTGDHTFRYYWTFGTSPSQYDDECRFRQSGDPGGVFGPTRLNERYANDIAVTAPTITCSPTP